ncbi:hypothetical protein L1987_57524 [Smallanthus sonchifolius]|uniref:Uncharacterized protein n=1 Tax=Smallanthus sonchifolius TaxID=185202 RepID=A0ACB9DCS8_9ASTR|nr:hypothetical protein L1987_57524 [Smallanthus sonchifolius]
MEKGNFKEAQSLSSQNEADTVVKHYYSAHDVADAFVKGYYKIMKTNPKDAHNFYKEQSIRSHPCADGSMKSATTLKGSDDEILASNIKKWNPDLSTLHAQDSVMKSVIIGVSGSLTDNADVARNFVQTFVLAPQEGGGFYVHNDLLQFIQIETEETSPPLDGVANPLTNQQANDTEKEDSLETAEATTNKDQSDKSTSKKENGDVKHKVSVSSKGKNIHPAEPKKKSQPSVWQPAPNKQEDAKKVSYASILAKEGSGSSTTSPSASPVGKVLAKTEKKTSVSPAVHKPSVFPVRSSMISNGGPLENIYDVKAIRIKDLPPKMTEESLLEVVKQFGPVKQNNIQIKEYSQDGYRYAFVEFDNPKSAHSAVEVRYIQFEDRKSEIQYKKLPNQGGHNYMGRPPYGRGGFRNDNFTGRDDEGRSSGGWGHKHNEQHEYSGQHSGQTREHNNYRRNRYSQDH